VEAEAADLLSVLTERDRWGHFGFLYQTVDCRQEAVAVVTGRDGRLSTKGEPEFHI